jgi:uncharacterized membrane protein YcaP (DUF421 family)
MIGLPEPPPLRRRIERPAFSLGLLAALSALPILVVSLGWDEQARASVLHVVLSFASLMLAFRVLGKRELSRLSPFELVTLMLIPEILSNTVQGDDSLLQGLAGLSTVLLLVLVTSLVSQRFPRLQNVMQASPSLLVASGQMLEHQMNRERIAPGELFSEMRKQGISRLADVHFAVLEGTGNITFVRHQPSQSGAADDEAGPSGS